MQRPATPENEPQRLQALRHCSILDTPAEERFDRLTRLAQQIFGTQMALISLVDSGRQWFKSRQGLDACETGRDVSFCGHAILTPETLTVSNALNDPRFHDNPLVTGAPHIRFYAGAPLTSADGYRIGTLCIIDDKPRELTVAEQRALRDLADCVEDEIRNTNIRLQRQELKKAKQLSEAIARSQSQFIIEPDRRKAFDSLLNNILELTESEYGFIGEVLYTPEGSPYLKTYAITNIAWNEDTRAFYEANAPKGMEFFNLNTLFGAALTSAKPVISNTPASDPHRGGLPEGHPALNAFLGMPIHHGGRMVAMLGIANRPAGYDQPLIDFIQPLLITIGQLIAAARLQQQNRTTTQLLDSIVENVPNVIFLKRASDLRYEFFNHAGEKLIGQSRHDLLGRNDHDLFPRELADFSSAKDRVVLEQDGIVDIAEEEIETPRGRRTLHTQKLALRNEHGEAQYLLGISEDITERKRADRMKNEFVSIVSHELRTPLTAISGSLALIAGGALGELPKEIHEMIKLAHRNSQRLSFLINDLLDMEKLVAGKMHLAIQTHALMPHVEQAILANRSYADQYGVKLEITRRVEGIMVAIDGQRFQQILANLLSNAAKFSPAGGMVEVSISCSGGHARIAVQDHGPGIPEEFRDTIFQKFAQADASDSRRKGGTGLGLAITKELVERMGGTIGFESVPGSGATFHFELPLCSGN